MAFVVDHIDHVVLNSRDVETTVDWYVRVLGMRRKSSPTIGSRWSSGSEKINVRPTGAPNWDGRRRRAGLDLNSASSLPTQL